MTEYIVKCREFVCNRGKTLIVPDYIDTSKEILRCRDCKYCEVITVSYSYKPFYSCTADWCEGAEGDNPLVKPDGFCAWAERKERIGS